MPVPDFQSFFKPILDIAADGQEHSLGEPRRKAASLMQLSDTDPSERLPTKKQIGKMLLRKALLIGEEWPDNVIGVGIMSVCSNNCLI